MRAVRVVLAFLWTSVAMAEFQGFAVSELNLNYQNGQGEARMATGYYKDDAFEVTLDNQNIALEVSGKDLLVQKPDMKILVKELAEGIIESIESIKLEYAEAALAPHERLYANVRGVRFHLGEGEQELQQFKIDCKRLNTKSLSDYLIPCFELGAVRIPLLKIDQLSRKTVSDALSGNMKGLFKAPEELRDIAFNIVNQRFFLTLKTKFIFKLQLKAQGSAIYDQENEQIIFGLEKAKVGWFSVKKTILKQIAKANIKNVSVSGERIIIRL